MVFADMRKVLFGELPADEFIAPLSASLVYFLITMCSGWLLRIINRVITPEPIKSYIADFSATLEMCAYFYENAFIFQKYGTACLVLLIIGELFISNRTFFGASVSPCIPFLAFLEARISLANTIFRIWLHTVAGFASYHYARMLWSLDMVTEHRARYLETGCNSDLNVALLTGIVIEASATLADTWLARQKVASVSIIDEFIKMTAVSIMVVSGKFCTCLPTCLPAYLPTYLSTCLPACLPAYLPACLPARLPAFYLPTYHMYLPTYMYIPTYYRVSVCLSTF